MNARHLARMNLRILRWTIVTGSKSVGGGSTTFNFATIGKGFDLSLSNINVKIMLKVTYIIKYLQTNISSKNDTKYRDLKMLKN